MSAAHDYEDLRHLLDRLPPAQVRRLRALVDSDPELSRFVEHETEPDHATDRWAELLSLVGLRESGQGDLAERHEEIIREGLDRPA